MIEEKHKQVELSDFAYNDLELFHMSIYNSKYINEQIRWVNLQW